jgi:hypothetical protein
VRVKRYILVVIVVVSISGLIPISPVRVGAQTATSFHPMQPTRLMDTRSGQGGTTLGPNETRNLYVAGTNGVPTAAVAVALNVTATNGSAPSYLTVWAAGSVLPIASNLNFVPGQTVPNMVTIGLGTAGAISIYNFAGSVDVIVDVTGWFSDGFHPIQPARVMDTRQGIGGAAIGPGEVRRLPVAGVGSIPADAVAVALNVTATDPTMPGYLTIFPTGSGLPTASNLNFVPGQTVPNMVTVGIGTDRTISIFNLAGSTQVIVDVTGWYSGGFHPVTPGRVMDSRAGQCGFTLHAGERREVQIVGLAGVPPTTAAAVALNVTATGASDATFLTLWPSGSSRPLASNLNVVPGQTVPNMALVGLGSGGRVALFNSTGDVEVIVDVDGWFDGAGPAGAGGCVVASPPPPPPPPTSPPTTAPPPTGFGDGTYAVGQQITAGRYQAPGGASCYWERLSGFGGSLNEIIANDVGGTHVIVDIAPTDAGFHTEHCGPFAPYGPPAAPAAAIGEGHWVVNQQIQPGTYQAAGGSSCYWERLRGFGGTLDAIITNDYATTNPIVTISGSDVGFNSTRCGTWSHL